MMRIWPLSAVPLGVLLLTASSAQADPDAVQIGDHGTSGRVVIALSGSVRASVVQRGDELKITASGETISTPQRLPHNVDAFAGGEGHAAMLVAKGARVRSVQSGNYLVLDVAAPTSAARAAKSKPTNRVNPAWTPPPAVRPAPPSAPTIAAPTAPSAAPVKPADAPATPAAPTTDSQTVEAAPADDKPAPPITDVIRVAAGPQVGAVAFRRGDLGVVVFDDRVDLAQDEDGGLPERATVQQMQGATMLTVPLAEGEALAMARDRDGWTVTVGAAGGTEAVQSAVPEGIAFQFDQSGRALTVSDPGTGQTLLLGTVRQPTREHSLIDARRTATGYVLLPTWLGLALEVMSDSVDLRATPTGFKLQIPDRLAPGTAAVAVRENLFKIPTAPAEVLVRQLDAQIASAATAQPRSRGAERIAAARTMLALGMAAEAQALLTLAANDDPAVAADPMTAALGGIAAVLAQRPGEAAGLDVANLPASGDVALWRSLRDVEQGKAASNMGTFWPTLARYPEAVRQRVGPTVIEAAIESGNMIPASELEGPAFAFARALQKEKAGEIDAALEQLDAIAGQRDERDSVRAAVAAAELRLSNGKITPAVAADEIERQTVRWRGNGQELAMRLRVAELRALAGQWRPALESLRTTETLFPETKERIAALKSGVFTLMLFAKDETLNPLEIVTVAGDFADCIPDGKEGEQLAGLLAEKLVALDLPSRAIPILQKLQDGSTSPSAKAEFGLRLAKLQLDASDPAKAEASLASIDPGTLPSTEAEQRLLLLAQARGARGDLAGAAALLAGAGTPESEDLRAGFLAKAGDWQSSLRALQNVATKLVPETGDLTEPQQDIIMREATAAVQAGDAAAMRDLKHYESRITPPRADVFRLLTANAVESPDDLPRAARELAMSRALPERLNALKVR